MPPRVVEADAVLHVELGGAHPVADADHAGVEVDEQPGGGRHLGGLVAQPEQVHAALGGGLGHGLDGAAGYAGVLVDHADGVPKTLAL